MPRMKTPSFLMRSSTSSSAKSGTPDVPRAESVLASLCTQGRPPAIYRALGGTVSMIQEGLAGSAVPAAIQTSLQTVADFLLLGAHSASEQLEFALFAHTNQEATTHFIDEMANSIRLICAMPKRSGPMPAVELALSTWQCDAMVFRQRCQEAWELHLYFCFLDVKGDHALLSIVAKQLMGMLETTPAGLVKNLSRTRPWVQSAFATFADRKALTILQSRHKESLAKWLSQVKGSVECKKDPNEFWNAFFLNLSRISWPDFLEALQNFFFTSKLPKDISEYLRAQLATPCKHRVARFSWDTLLQKFGGLLELLESLLKDIVHDLPSAIYEPEFKGLPSSSLSNGGKSPSVDSPVSSQVDSAAHFPDQSKLQRPPSSASTSTWSMSDDKAAPLDVTRASTVPRNNLAPVGVGVHGDFVDMTPSQALQGESVTPVDPRMRFGPVEPGQKLQWGEFVARLHAVNAPWWLPAGEQIDTSTQLEEPIHVRAMQAIRGAVSPSTRALILRIVSGDLAHNRPILEIPASSSINDGSTLESAKHQASRLPALVITATDLTSCDGVTKFGRGSNRQMMLPDIALNEPIASRSHFNIIHDAKTDRFQIMDTGSKWGTFIKVSSSPEPVSCGDWIRIGNAEFVIRFCGGSCKRHRQHAHHRLHSLTLSKSIYGGPDAFKSSYMPWRLSFSHWSGESADKDELDDLEEDIDVSEDKAAGSCGLASRSVELLSGRHAKAWSTPFDRMCHQSDGASSSTRTESTSKSCEKTRINSSASRSSKPALSLPVSPLEIDFISGPRMGERLLVTDRVCTVGRGENSTIQMSDPMLANVSRLHCIFEYIGNGWKISDNKSTNGTWRRLSCVLDPSEPRNLVTGMSLLAGVHELQVEEAKMGLHPMPSAANVILRELQSSP
jgi:pSer/pThr/pTyr-binding forkhead associated (FHA) protein